MLSFPEVVGSTHTQEPAVTAGNVVPQLETPPELVTNTALLTTVPNDEASIVPPAVAFNCGNVCLIQTPPSSVASMTFRASGVATGGVWKAKNPTPFTSTITPVTIPEVLIAFNAAKLATGAC